MGVCDLKRTMRIASNGQRSAHSAQPVQPARRAAWSAWAPSRLRPAPAATAHAAGTRPRTSRSRCSAGVYGGQGLAWCLVQACAGRRSGLPFPSPSEGVYYRRSMSGRSGCVRQPAPRVMDGQAGWRGGVAKAPAGESQGSCSATLSQIHIKILKKYLLPSNPWRRRRRLGAVDEIHDTSRGRAPPVQARAPSAHRAMAFGR